MIRIMVAVVSRLTISCYKTATMLFSLGFFSRPEIDVILLQLPYARVERRGNSVLFMFILLTLFNTLNLMGANATVFAF